MLTCVRTGTRPTPGRRTNTSSSKRSAPSPSTSPVAPVPAQGQGTFSLVPAGQLGIDESALPVQNLDAAYKCEREQRRGGPQRDERDCVQWRERDGAWWAEALVNQRANRYLASVLCSW